MIVERILPIEPYIKVYPISKYKNHSRIPPVEKIVWDLENSSRQIQKLDLFKYYGQKGIEHLYSKGQFINYTI